MFLLPESKSKISKILPQTTFLLVDESDVVMLSNYDVSHDKFTSTSGFYKNFPKRIVKFSVFVMTPFTF